MEGIIRAWGKILAGRRPNLSIEITRECPLRCPGCYAYGDEHLGGGQTLRTLNDRKGAGAHRRHSRAGRPVTAAARVAGRRRTPRAVSRARRAAATTGGARALRAGRDERGATDSRGVGVDTASADLCLDRRAAAGARCAADAGHLRSHPQAHRRPPDHRALHGDTAADRARGLPRGVRSRVVEQRQRAIDLAQPLYAPGRRDFAGTVDARRSAAGRRYAARATRALPETADAATAARCLPGSACLAGAVHLCANHGVRLGGPADGDHAVPVRRHTGLLELRLHGVSRSRRGWASSPRRRDRHRPAVRRIDSRRAGGERLAARRRTVRHVAARRRSPGAADDLSGSVERILHGCCRCWLRRAAR